MKRNGKQTCDNAGSKPVSVDSRPANVCSIRVNVSGIFANISSILVNVGSSLANISSRLANFGRSANVRISLAKAGRSPANLPAAWQMLPADW